MSYYAKDDYVLLRDAEGGKAATLEGGLEIWNGDAGAWETYGLLKRHLGQNVLVRITAMQAEAIKKEDGGPSQPAQALTGGKGKKPGLKVTP